MAVKYRIEYEAYPLYQKKHGVKQIQRLLFLLALCTALLFFLVYPHALVKLRDLFLPGDSTVTAVALQELSATLNAGGSFSDAIDVFCDAIMDVR